MEATVVVVVVEVVVVVVVVVVEVVGAVVLGLVVEEVVALGEVVTEEVAALVVEMLEDVVDTSDVVGAAVLWVVEAASGRLVATEPAVGGGSEGEVVAEPDESDAHAAASKTNPVTRQQVRSRDWLIRAFTSVEDVDLLYGPRPKMVHRLAPTEPFAPLSRNADREAAPSERGR